MTLVDFHALARERGADLTLVEVGVLRMYTAEFYQPWNNALRGLEIVEQPGSDGEKTTVLREDGGVSLLSRLSSFAATLRAIVHAQSSLRPPILSLHTIGMHAGWLLRSAASRTGRRALLCSSQQLSS
jgi:hypothetical protein